MKITAKWLYYAYPDIMELDIGDEMFLDPLKIGVCQSGIVQGVNRVLDSLSKEKLVNRIEWKVSGINGVVRIRRV